VTRFRYVAEATNAARIAEWLRTRGGIAIWRSVDLSDLDKSWTTPLRDESGARVTSPPHWKAEGSPSTVITDPAEVGVTLSREVARFRIAVRRGTQGLSLKLTDASSRRVRAAVDKAGEGAHYTFDYGTQEAVILAPEKEPVPLREWLADREEVRS